MWRGIRNGFPSEPSVPFLIYGAGFERVRIGFSAEGLSAMELMDHFGQTTRLRFSNVVRNPKVDAKEFRFDPPKGSDVLGDK